MKRVLIVVLLLFAMQAVRAQKVYFIYIQSESNAPFFVKMGDKVASSTAAGYVILPKLVDSVYSFTVGKNGQAAVESRFSVTISKKDRGFLLREADGKFSLFDLQAMTSVQPIAAANSATETIAKRSDAFTVLLAQAANDPSLLDVRATPAVKLETAKPTETIAAVTTQTKEPETTAAPVEEDDTATQNTKADVNTTGTSVSEETSTKEPAVADVQPANVDTVQQTTAVATEQQATPQEEVIYKPSIVTRRSESSTSEGFGLVFLDETNGVVDTVRIVIPNQSSPFRSSTPDDEDSKKFLNITNTDSAGEAGAAVVATSEVRKTDKKKKCSAEAGERDFFKLRKNMAAEESDDAMIREAKKAFKRSCFSTDQIKKLSSLFLTASGKYQFFDAAYNYVSNQEQYAMLQSELTEDYYVNRFKVLIATQ